MSIEVKENRKFDQDGNVATGENPSQLSAITIIASPRVYGPERPLRDHVYVKQHEAESTYQGTTFVIPDAYVQNPNVGVVVAVGPWIRDEFDAQGVLTKKADCKPGDIVRFGKFNAEPIEIDGDEYQLVSVHDLKGVRDVTFAVQFEG